MKKDLHSLECSLSRTKNNFYDYARSNIWDWFVTFTFSPDQVDRTDYVECKNKLCKWLNNIRNRYAPDLKYVIVPEQHKKNKIGSNYAWHFHGLLSDVGGLVFNPYICRNGCQLTKYGRPIYILPQYTLGFSNAQKVDDSFRISRYMCKYVTKEMCVMQKGRQRYLCSQNLKKPQEYCISIYDLEDVYNAFAVNYEKSVSVNLPMYHQQITYMHCDALDPGDDISTIIDKLQLDRWKN